MIRVKKLTEIEGLELFEKYAVDVNGNIWSYKYNKPKILKPGWVKNRENYLFVRLTDVEKKQKNFYVHRLVAMAYLPCNDYNLEVNHINGNLSDNRIENLEWVTKKKISEHIPITKGFVLNEDLSNKIKEVHSASHRKGLPVPNSYEFLNIIVNRALDEYINQYGLRKIMANK